jgi:hypothetical protein
LRTPQYYSGYQGSNHLVCCALMAHYQPGYLRKTGHQVVTEDNLVFKPKGRSNDSFNLTDLSVLVCDHDDGSWRWKEAHVGGGESTGCLKMEHQST